MVITPPYDLWLSVSIKAHFTLALITNLCEALVLQRGRTMDIKTIYKTEKQRAKTSMVLVALVSTLSSLCLLAVPLYLFQVYDRVLTSRSLETLLALTAFAAILLMTFGALDALRQVMLTRIGSQFEARVAGPIFAGELSKTDGDPAYALQLVGDTRRLIASGVFISLFDLPLMIVFLFIVFLIHPILAIIVLSGIVILASLTIVGEWLTRDAIGRVQSTNRDSKKLLSNYIQQHELIRSLGMYPQIVNEWGNSYGAHLSENIKASTYSNTITSASRMTRQMIQIAMIGGGAALVISGQVTAGIIFATSVVATRALAPIEAVVGSWRQLRQGLNNFKSLEDRIDTYNLMDNRTPLPTPSGAIKIENLTYVPPGGGGAIVKNISGAIQAGQIIAIVGSSGAGKSTFARLLVGAINPSAGRILLDGQNISSWDVVARGKSTGYVPQQINFFEGTVRDNISRLNKHDLPELAIEAAKFVGVHEKIMSFPMGYDTIISDNGFQPSGGQKQLIALSRAYYNRPSFVVLDEPNANLDGEGEAILANALRKSKEAGITAIIVTQKLSVLSNVDKVLVLKKGSVEKFGPVDEVMPKKIVQAVPSKVS